MKRDLLMLLLLSAAATTLASPAMPPQVAAKDERPAKWAKPITLKGVPNLHEVSTNLYRSAQPTAAGMKKLKEMGIATVINLRSFHSDRDEIGSTGLAYEHIYMKAWHPERKEAVRFLQIASDPKRQPVLVHCQHGADRTGTMCALYRICIEGWSKEDAIKEMTEGGYGYHEIFENLQEWIEELDIDALKKDAGLAKDDNGEKIKSMIEDLGSKQFKKREAAQANLAAQGQAALEQLKAAKKHTDPEIRARVQTIIDLIENKGKESSKDDGKFATYVVEPGDDIYSIAMMWGVSVRRIKEANNLQGDNPFPGQKIKIPISE